MVVNWILPVRGVQAVLSVVVLGLMAYVASWWSSHWRQFSPSEVNYMIFTPVWSILALIALLVIPWKMPRMAESRMGKYGLLFLDTFSMIHWLAGFIALAVFLNDRICFGTVCSVAKAGVAISAFAWVAWTATFVYAMIRLFKGGVRSAGSVEPKVEMHQGV